VFEPTENKIIFDSGFRVGTENQLDVEALEYDLTFRFELRIYTNGNRIATVGHPGYFTDSISLLIEFDGTIEPLDSLTVLPHANYPWVEVKWVYTDSVPDSFVVIRDGVTLGRFDPPLVDTGIPNEYHYFDFPPNRSTSTWQVIALFKGVGATDGTPAVTKVIHHNFSWLVSQDLSCHVMLGNLEPTKDIPGNTVVVEPLSGRPVVITQGVVTERGRITARVANNIVPETAKEMLAMFYRIRDVYGGRAKLFLYDRILDVFIYDLVQYERAKNSETLYDIEFNYIQTV
jgi:hypothetical protein